MGGPRARGRARRSGGLAVDLGAGTADTALLTKAGGTNAAFVTRAYQDVLGRAPDPSGQAYWTNKADRGTERGQIARQFLASAEAKRTIVRDQFLRFLDRQPTTTEIATWSSKLDGDPNGEQALVSFLAGSAAYFQRS